MKRIATIYNGTVIGVEEWDGKSEPKASGVDFSVIDDDNVTVGWVYNDGIFISPPHINNEA